MDLVGKVLIQSSFIIKVALAIAAAKMGCCSARNPIFALHAKVVACGFLVCLERCVIDNVRVASRTGVGVSCGAVVS